VCDLQTRLIEIECETYDTIDAVHEKLYEQEGVPTLLTRLAQKIEDPTYTWTDPPGWRCRAVMPRDARVARDDDTPTLVSDYDIQEGEILTFRVNMPGMPGSKPMPGQEHEWWWEEKRETKKFLEYAEGRGLGGMHGYGMGTGLICDQQAKIHGYKDYEEQALAMGWSDYDMQKKVQKKVKYLRNMCPAPPQTKFVVKGDGKVIKLGPAMTDHLVTSGATFAHLVVTTCQGLPDNNFRVIKKPTAKHKGTDVFSDPDVSAVCCGPTDAEISACLSKLHRDGKLTANPSATYQAYNTKKEAEAEFKEKSLQDFVLTFSGTDSNLYPDYHLNLTEYQARHQAAIEQQLLIKDEHLAKRKHLQDSDSLPGPVPPEPDTREYRMQLEIKKMVLEAQENPVAPFRFLRDESNLKPGEEIVHGAGKWLEKLSAEMEDEAGGPGKPIATMSQKLFGQASVADW